KAQEYKERKVYDISRSTLKRNGAPEACACEEKTEGVADATYLFTTATCPNCKIACALLDKAGVQYEKLLANEHVDLVETYGVKQAPTLIVVKDGMVAKYVGVSDIKKMLGA
ncbi:MAG: thioredoxin family protein, partial [Ruminococcaceae bacterium]|nr:thioredoxin family protein [Oscillospiraceae bacterium]